MGSAHCDMVSQKVFNNIEIDKKNLIAKFLGSRVA
jgi:hypothetical protein